MVSKVAIKKDENGNVIDRIVLNINKDPAELGYEWDPIDNSYIEHRLSAYPDIGEQLDALYRAGAFPEEMAALIKAVKDQFPKP